MPARLSDKSADEGEVPLPTTSPVPAVDGFADALQASSDHLKERAGAQFGDPLTG